MPDMKKHYNEVVRPELMKRLGLTNVMQIPKLQKMFSGKNKKEEAKTTGSDKAPVQAAVVEEVVEEADDLELIAVIAAAIAASEGAASTDGFVVRSIRKARR